MSLGLELPLAERPLATERFLRAALVLDRPQLADLLAAGVPHWDARDLLLRLERSGECGDAGWDAAARTAYATCLADRAGERPAHRLERLAEEDRPREKALREGIASLADAELIAVLLRIGTGEEGVLERAERLLDQVDGLAGLARHEAEGLAALPGLGPASATVLAAACEMGRRLAASQLRSRPELRTPEAVAGLLGPISVAQAVEQLWCLPLDRQSRLIGAPRVVTRGDVDGTDAGPRAFFRCALAAGAVQAIAVHNHPGGDPRPSPADRAVTRRLVEAGRTLDIALSDHVVLGDGQRFCSLRRDEPELFR